MALINCPECQKEISDKVKACPHCGYPFELNSEISPQKVEITDVNIKSFKVKPLILSICIVFALIAVSYFIFQNVNKNSYIQNLKNIHSKMLAAASNAENLTSLTHDVWYNSIHKDLDSKTDKYTIRENAYSFGRTYYSDSDFWSDFNIALSNLATDKEIITKKNDLRELQEEINSLMKKMQNPPNGYQNIYNDLDKLYITFLTLSELALNPSGSLTTFTSKVNECDSTFLEYYNKIKLYLP